MQWASILVDSREARKGKVLSDMLVRSCEQINSQLNGTQPDLVVVFVSPNFSEEYDKVSKIIYDRLSPRQMIGCSASGLIGGGQEIETQPAVAITAAILPDVSIKTFHLVTSELPDLDDPPGKWEEVVGCTASENPHFILLPDPFSFRIDNFLQGLDFAFPQSAKIGGLASGARKAGMNGLFMNERLFRNGMVGAALHGNVQVDTVIAQGCRPVGKPLRVTKVMKNIIFELDGKVAVEALHDLIGKLTPKEQELVKDSLFIGIAMDEFKMAHKPGDFLIRNIVGIEASSGALVVSELLREEQTVQFHVRDAASSADDLRQLLKQYRDSNKEKIDGALLFSCLGRGEHLYGMPNHDSDCFREYLGPVPLGGFFCNGEIGPVGGTTFLHGYTSSFGIFRPKSTTTV